VAYQITAAQRYVEKAFRGERKYETSQKNI
jgi:hypothetical protein